MHNAAGIDDQRTSAIQFDAQVNPAFFATVLIFVSVQSDKLRNCRCQAQRPPPAHAHAQPAQAQAHAQPPPLREPPLRTVGLGGGLVTFVTLPVNSDTSPITFCENV